MAAIRPCNEIPNIFGCVASQDTATVANWEYLQTLIAAGTHKKIYSYGGVIRRAYHTTSWTSHPSSGPPPTLGEIIAEAGDLYQGTICHRFHTPYYNPDEYWFVSTGAEWVTEGKTCQEGIDLDLVIHNAGFHWFTGLSAKVLSAVDCYVECTCDSGDDILFPECSGDYDYYDGGMSSNGCLGVNEENTVAYANFIQYLGENPEAIVEESYIDCLNIRRAKIIHECIDGACLLINDPAFVQENTYWETKGEIGFTPNGILFSGLSCGTISQEYDESLACGENLHFYQKFIKIAYEFTDIDLSNAEVTDELLIYSGGTIVRYFNLDELKEIEETIIANGKYNGETLNSLVYKDHPLSKLELHQTGGIKLEVSGLSASGLIDCTGTEDYSQNPKIGSYRCGDRIDDDILLPPDFPPDDEGNCPDCYEYDALNDICIYVGGEGCAPVNCLAVGGCEIIEIEELVPDDPNNFVLPEIILPDENTKRITGKCNKRLNNCEGN